MAKEEKQEKSKKRGTDTILTVGGKAVAVVNGRAVKPKKKKVEEEE